MLILIASVLSLLVGFSVQTLHLYHQRSSWLTTVIKDRQAAQADAFRWQALAERLGKELSLHQQMQTNQCPSCPLRRSSS
ncbi:hypothetical protein BJF83_24280 [Nocardiopsis sp. CNR-923]|uniref:hypothetical protein n=1 Tax=Nocardiopsis sp. CNR-923 TaxID=1904965 RepID=UPI00095C8632|nr:hypothetical protein [Nocardiopsis sp. CNR-923]OLT24335.1 hypothetical protein BJF83_24280 [Nocardiopsis sp. CNR-923]